jgi:hypothetical protein
MGGLSRGVVAAWLAVVLLAACEGQDYKYPSERCPELIDAWCDKTASCMPPSERADTRETCEFGFKLDLDCSKVTGVSAYFDSCIATLRAASCEGFTVEKGLPYPEICKGIIQQ